MSTTRDTFAVLAGLAFAGCSGSDGAREAAPQFNEGVEPGAQCSELFEIRNSRDPKSPQIEGANETLRFGGLLIDF